MTNDHPYKRLPNWADWRRSIADRNMFHIADLWSPRFEITKSMRIATFGSCFAQHIGRSMKARGYSWLDCEPAPPGLTREHANQFNYGVFSARTGNIYTSSILRQWTEWAAGLKQPPDEVWTKGDRFIDPFRPRIEPEGFASKEEMAANRAITIDRFRQCIEKADVFVFTLGLTESWFNKTGGYEYPLCPGTAAGTFDPDEHVFVNQDYDSVRANLIEALSIMRSINPSLRFLLTVSPVPLVATNAGRHVLVSTMASKSILRAVADSLAGTKIKPSLEEIEPTANRREWAVYGDQVRLSEDSGESGQTPKSNPFSGLKSRTPLSVAEGDEAIVQIKTDSESPILVDASPNPTTRKGGVGASTSLKNGVMEAKLQISWTGAMTIWISPKQKSALFEIQGVRVVRQNGGSGLIDYFPSYEIINSPAFGGVFFERDRREVSAYGVGFVMNHFFSGLGVDPEARADHKKDAPQQDALDIVCDEMILGSFSQDAK